MKGGYASKQAKQAVVEEEERGGVAPAVGSSRYEGRGRGKLGMKGWEGQWRRSWLQREREGDE